MDHLPMVKIGTERRSLTAMPRAEIEAKRETMLSLPGWAASRVGWLGTVTWQGQTKYYLTNGLPRLTTTERQQLERQLTELEYLVSPADGDEEKKLMLVTKMALALASAAASDKGAEARGEAYLFALSGVPAWPVQEAIFQWYTGKVRDIAEADLKWMPSPAVLLRATQDILKPYQDAILKIRRLLDAKPLDEILR